MGTPESTSASRRLGFRVWSFPTMPSSLVALTVETGSQKSGTETLSASQRRLSAGMLVSTTQRAAFSMMSSLRSRWAGSSWS